MVPHYFYLLNFVTSLHQIFYDLFLFFGVNTRFFFLLGWLINHFTSRNTSCRLGSRHNFHRQVILPCACFEDMYEGIFKYVLFYHTLNTYLLVVAYFLCQQLKLCYLYNIERYPNEMLNLTCNLITIISFYLEIFFTNRTFQKASFCMCNTIELNGIRMLYIWPMISLVKILLLVNITWTLSSYNVKNARHTHTHRHTCITPSKFISKSLLFKTIRAWNIFIVKKTIRAFPSKWCIWKSNTQNSSLSSLTRHTYFIISPLLLLQYLYYCKEGLFCRHNFNLYG